MPEHDKSSLLKRKSLTFAGRVYVDEGGLCDVGPRIADRDVIEEIDRTWPYRPGKRSHVRVYLGVEPVAEGPIWAVHGFGGTDVTPPDSPQITVGAFDLLGRLDDLDGREVLLIVEDGDA